MCLSLTRERRGQPPRSPTARWAVSVLLGGSWKALKGDEARA